MSHLSALVAALGKPIDVMTFGDFGDKFLGAVVGSGFRYQEVHVIFDSGTNRIPSRQVRENVAQKQLNLFDVLLRTGTCHFLVAGLDFLALPENKADLARFLSEHLIANAPAIIFYAAHEEADTRIVFYHCIASTCETVVESARDTDVLLLLVAHDAAKIRSAKIWMMAGTAAHRKFFNVRAISENLPVGSLSSLLPFHALTGCDSTSFLCDHGKTSAWKMFLEKHNLLSSVGEGNLTTTRLKMQGSLCV